MEKDKKINIFWFRRDLRLEDNKGLYKALSSKYEVLPIFIFDSEILEGLPKNDARVTFIYEILQSIRNILIEKHQRSMAIYHGSIIKVFKELIKSYSINTVFTNHDYEPYATQRDNEVCSFLNKNHIKFKTYKDQVIFEKKDIVKSDGKPYLVYTPYMKTWLKNLNFNTLKLSNTRDKLKNLINDNKLPNLSLSDMGFKKSNQKIEPYQISSNLIKNYEETRNFPALNSTSKLGPHLRFGTISIREIVKSSLLEKNKVFLKELIWREFFMQILWHFPQTIQKSFKPKYDRIKWRNNHEEFKAWCNGQTGYPLVDAGMRQLNKTGFMHNRVRMLVGSFLCKHLLIDWRWGEAYFAQKLHDYEMASNIGNWQWVAGCGVDAAPYFRIFNPTTQLKKFDNNLIYVKKWAPDFQEISYPKPIVEHKFARERCLKVYKDALY
ncbi:DNA photolyase family protein [Seonamhaeicola sp. MEBiC1930]|uniref:cryptochrome/photolyase family protein n=1 Tax=Seonamhaeicola sp. MEBiC01930 TaxID=2976768 RepID=UPI0032451D66